MSKPRREKRDISGWLILNKAYDVSSTEAVGKVRWLYSAKKAGHAGTLDPLATGVLPIALGEATKTVPYVQDGEKVYRFEVKWGEATNTDDAEGEVIATSDHRPSETETRAALAQFVGEITQVPPAFSAIKIRGERAYDLARAGEKVEVPPRQVFIDRFGLIEHSDVTSTFEVACAKGTYVRALARDLARVLGTQAHVSGLHRARVGPFSDEDAISIDALEDMTPDARDRSLQPIASALQDLPEVRLDPVQTQKVRQGNPALLVGANAPIEMDEAVGMHRGQVVALGYVERGQFKPTRVIRDE